MYVLNANHISKSYKTAGETMRILQNVNLQVMKGEMVAIMGHSLRKKRRHFFAESIWE